MVSVSTHACVAIIGLTILIPNKGNKMGPLSRSQANQNILLENYWDIPQRGRSVEHMTVLTAKFRKEFTVRTYNFRQQQLELTELGNLLFSGPCEQK